MLRCPSQAPELRGGTHITSAGENHWGFCLPLGERRLLETPVLSWRPAHKIWSLATQPEVQYWGDDFVIWESYREDLGGVASKKYVKGQTPNFLCLVPIQYCHQMPYFQGQTLHFILTPHFYSYTTRLESALSQSSNCWWHYPAKMESCRKMFSALERELLFNFFGEALDRDSDRHWVV